MASMRVTLVRSKKQNMYNRAYVNPESLELYREIRQNQRARCGAVGSEHGCALINDILAVQLHADGALRQNEIALNERQFKSAKTWKGCVVSVAKFELPNNIEMEALYVELQMPSGTPNRVCLVDAIFFILGRVQKKKRKKKAEFQVIQKIIVGTLNPDLMAFLS
uniref:Uncharacterized protein MANES_14G081000 n=1 Tax=Rhizophora mucronata TaxID=61149 RepID=A0A2P2MAR4_RHIMU